MPLTLEEFTLGAIAYFDVAVLHANASVVVTGDPVVRAGAGNQFVCFRVAGDTSSWAPLTATERPERLRLETPWITNGYGPLAFGQVFLQDGKNTYTGPNAAFVSASQSERPFKSGRPQVDAEGLRAIAAEIQARGGST